MKSGFAAIIGRPNVGKSTLLNQILGQKIVIATDKAQTTRKRIKGIYTTVDGQVVFIDTPGVHKPLNKLGEFLLDKSKMAVPDADLILFLVDGSEPAGKGDKWIAQNILQTDIPVIIVMNKVDKLKNINKVEENLLTYKVLFEKNYPVVRISAKTGRNIDTLLKNIYKYLPEGDLLYPKSEQALSVRNVFMQRSEEAGVVFQYEQEVLQIQRQKHQYLIKTNSQNIIADVIVLAMGSEAGKLSGMNTSRYEILKQMHLKVVEPVPSLVQFYTSPVLKSLKGVRVKGTFSLVENEKCIHQEKGELLFTDYGVSGIAVMQLSSFYQKHHHYQLYIDFFDELSHNQLCQLLSKQSSLFLEGLMNHKIAKAFQKYQYLSIDQLVSLLKHYPLEIKGIREASYAQVMKGGLSLKEVTEDLELKQYPCIYAMGEILNVAGMCGGYNLHFAFDSAYRVAKAIERNVYVKNS